MCTLATKQESTWLMVDSWEAFLNYQRTAVVLDHFNYEINTVLGGVHTRDGEHRDVRIMLLAGSDLISTMSEPGVWSHNDVGISLAFNVLYLTDVLIFSSIIYLVVMAHLLLSAQDPAWIKRLTAWRVGETISILFPS
jgi:hypothetical protein